MIPLDTEQFEYALRRLAAKTIKRNPGLVWYSEDDWLNELGYNATPGQDLGEVAAEVVHITVEDAVVGGEDKFIDGEGEVFTLFKVESSGGTQFFKRSGIYRSFDGTTWGGLYRS